MRPQGGSDLGRGRILRLDTGESGNFFTYSSSSFTRMRLQSRGPSDQVRYSGGQIGWTDELDGSAGQASRRQSLQQLQVEALDPHFFSKSTSRPITPDPPHDVLLVFPPVDGQPAVRL